MSRLAILLALAGTPAFATGLEIDVAGEANGTIVIDLFEDVAPQHVARIVELAQGDQYDNVVFHRVIEGFMAQTGDVQFGKEGGDLALAGTGGSDLPDLPAEFSDRSFTRGVVGMARSADPNSANSQFFIMSVHGRGRGDVGTGGAGRDQAGHGPERRSGRDTRPHRGRARHRVTRSGGAGPRPFHVPQKVWTTFSSSCGGVRR
jgi:peptidylprolyl isomerase